MPTVHRRDVVTRDRDEASEFMRGVFPSMSIGPSDDGRPFFLHQSVTSDGRLSLHQLEIDGSARGTGSVPELVAVGGVRSGRLGLTYGRHEVDTSLPYLRPPGESEMRIEDATLHLVTLDPSAFRSVAARHLGGDDVAIGSRELATAPRSRALGAAWRSASTRILSAVADDAAFSSVLVRDQLFDMAVRAILGAFPVAGEERTAAETVSTAHSVARATAYIDEHVDEHVSLADIAAAARLSVRGVQYAFRRHLGVTPLAYLRDRRLDAARVDLIAADPAVVSVADVARRWGFAHLSRFAQSYQERFGEYPRSTIRS